ncbi:hypothetical protein WJX73_007829 [Symbiochloris irregularis]|uniref:Uncharacterized protein n=1 Tax=Symbiochloris irregularis TaxID=706552 RepID=A0AAW1PU77_9CHLO
MEPSVLSDASGAQGLQPRRSVRHQARALTWKFYGITHENGSCKMNFQYKGQMTLSTTILEDIGSDLEAATELESSFDCESIQIQSAGENGVVDIKVPLRWAASEADHARVSVKPPGQKAIQLGFKCKADIATWLGSSSQALREKGWHAGMKALASLPGGFEPAAGI